MLGTAAGDRMSTAGVFRRRLTTIVKVHRRCFTLTKLKKYSTRLLRVSIFRSAIALPRPYVGIHFLEMWHCIFHFNGKLCLKDTLQVHEMKGEKKAAKNNEERQIMSQLHLTQDSG